MTRAGAGLLLVLLVGGCQSAGQIAGLVAGAAAGGASANPAVGFAVGVGTAAATGYAVRTVSRRWHQTEQDAIATAAGPLGPGGEGKWAVEHDLPFGNGHGRVTVVGALRNPLTDCKRIAFSEQDDGKEPWYLTDICRQGGAQGSVWKWAGAEPAVARWGNLQ